MLFFLSFCRPQSQALTRRAWTHGRAVKPVFFFLSPALSQSSPFCWGCCMYIPPWFRPFSQHRRYCQLPVSGRRMQRFLQFRLGSHQLPIVLGRFAGGQHVARANRVCTHCGSVAVADELHMIFECPALQAVRQRYAPLFSTDTNTMRSFFAQQDHMQVFKFVLDCLDVFHI